MSTRASTKRQSSPGSDFVPLITRPVVAVLLLALLFTFRRDAWILQKGLMAFPLAADLFLVPSQLLAGFRWVLPLELLSPHLLSLSLLSPFLWLVGIFLLRRFVPGPRLFSWGISIFIAASLTPWGIVGTSPRQIAEWVMILWALIPLLVPTSSLWLWITASLACVLAFLFPSFHSLVFWSLLSWSTGQILQFIFVQRLLPLRSKRLQKKSFLLRTLGMIALAASLLGLLLERPFNAEIWGPSTFYWLAFIDAALIALLTWISPWKVDRWLPVTTFVGGALLFRNLDHALFFVTAWLLLQIATELLFKGAPGSKKSKPPVVLVLFFIFCLIGGLSFGAWKLSRLPLKHEVDPAWAQAIKKMPDKEARGVVIVGNGLALFSHFYSGPVVSYPELLIESDEKKWADFMEKEKLHFILVEVAALKATWTKWIQGNKPPDTLNKSLLSRLVEYEGKETSTRTLKLSAVKDFSIQRWPDLPSFVLIEKIDSSVAPTKASP